MGPNVKKLIAHKMARDAVPGSGGIRAALEFLSDSAEIKSKATDATKWVTAAIHAVRVAKDPNPFKNADDESIAAEILRQIEKRKTS